MAERIKVKVQEKLTEKNKAKREKLIAELDKKLACGKISKAMSDEKLWQFDNVVESQIDNEMAKAIEKAHNYHFNLQNYCSNLSEEQIKDWQETLKGVEAKNGSKIEKRYQELQKANPQTALSILASFDPKDALQMDIAREYLSRVDKKVLEQDETLGKLEEILRKGFQYPLVLLKDLIIVNDEKIKPLEFPETEFTVLGVSNQTGVFINEKLKGEDIKQGYFKVYKNQFCYNPYRINVGSIGFCEFDIENQIISGAYNVFGCNESELNPKYLDALLKTKKFLDYVNEKASGGVRMDFKIESMQEWQIPLPPLETQNEIVEKIEKQKQIIEGAERIEGNYNLEVEETHSKKELLKNITDEITKGTTPTTIGGEYLSSGIFFVRSENILTNKLDISSSLFISRDLHKKELKRSFINKNSVLLNIVGASIGRSCVYNIEEEANCNQAVCILRPNIELVLPKYLSYWLNSKNTQSQMFKEKYGGARDNLNLGQVGELEIPLPSLSTQRQIVEKLDRQMQALEGVRLLKSEAEKRIEEILTGVWGE